MQNFKAISGTSHDILVRFLQSVPFINVYFNFTKSDMAYKCSADIPVPSYALLFFNVLIMPLTVLQEISGKQS